MSPPVDDFASDPDLEEALRALARADDAAHLPGERVGPYEIVSRLGRGGTGIVYRARDLRLGREIALKLPLAAVARDPTRRALLLHEARAAAAVAHPNVTAIHDVGGPDGEAYVVSELVDGTTLRRRLADGPLDLPLAAAYARQIAAGLAAAHAAGVVHRDLKPENIVIGPTGTVKILDFGLAKVLAEDALALGGCGTREYMPPEQAAGGSVDARADVFAFGVVFAEMLTATRPRSPLEVPRTLEDRSPAVYRLLRACLARAPDERPADGDALLRALAQLGARTEARPLSRLFAVATVLVLSVTGLAAARILRGSAAPAGSAASAVAPPRVTKVTRNSAEVPVTAVALSRDASMLAYAEARGVFVVDLASSGSPKLVTAERVSSLHWAPDGSGLLVAVDGALVRLSVDGPRREPLGIAQVDTFAVPEHGDAAFVVRGGTIRAVDLATRTERLLVRDAGRRGSAIACSPSGTTIAWLTRGASVAGRPFDATLELIDVATSRREMVVHDGRLADHVGEAGVTFTAEDRVAVALAAAGGEPSTLAEMTFDRTTLRPSTGLVPLATFGTASVSRLDASARGHKLSLVHALGQTDVYTAGLDATGALAAPLRRRTFSETSERPSDFTYDGRLLMVVEDDGAQRAVRLEDDGRAGPSAFADQPWTTWTSSRVTGDLVGFALESESRDAAKLALVHADARGRSLAVRTLGNVPIRTTGRPPPHDFAIACGRRADRCWLAHADGDAVSLERIDAQSLASVSPPVSLRGVTASFGLAASEDGAQLAIAESRGDAFGLFDADGNRTARIPVPAGCVAQFVTFDSARACLVATTVCLGHEAPYELIRIPLGGESPRVLASSASSWLSHPTVSFDGTQIAVAEMPFESNAYVVDTGP